MRTSWSTAATRRSRLTADYLRLTACCRRGSLFGAWGAEDVAQAVVPLVTPVLEDGLARFPSPDREQPSRPHPRSVIVRSTSVRGISSALTTLPTLWYSSRHVRPRKTLNRDAGMSESGPSSRFSRREPLTRRQVERRHTSDAILATASQATTSRCGSTRQWRRPSPRQRSARRFGSPHTRS